MPTTDAQNLQNAVNYVKTVNWITWTDQDALISIYVESAVAKIKEITWIDLLEMWEIEKKLDGAWQRIVFLPQSAGNIIFVKTSVGINWSQNDVNASSYVLKDNGELVFNFNLPRGYKNIDVKYTNKFSEFTDIPREYSDLKLALALLVGNLKNSQETSGISSESVSWTSITFDKTTMTSNITALLNKFITFSI